MKEAKYTHIDILRQYQRMKCFSKEVQILLIKVSCFVSSVKEQDYVCKISVFKYSTTRNRGSSVV
jgi:hypothetical protein